MAKIILNGEIGFEITLANIMGAVKLYPNETIDFHVTSFGGSVVEGLKIYEYLQGKTNINVIFDGICASACTFCFLSLPKENLKAFDDTQFYMHWARFFYFIEDKNSKELVEDAQELEKWDKVIKDIYLKHLNITEAELNTIMIPEAYINNIAAMGFGLISETITHENIVDKFKMPNFNEISLKIAAYLPKPINNNNNKQKEKMENLENEVKEQKSILNKILDFLTPKIKALLISTEEGSDIEFQGDVLEVGTSVKSDTADGTYTLMYEDKKWKVTILEKKVTEIVEVVEEPTQRNEEVEALKAKITELESQLQAQNTMKAELAKNNEVIAKLAKLHSINKKPDGSYDFNSKGLKNEMTTSDKIKEVRTARENRNK